MSKKVDISLRPYTAIVIKMFLREHVNERTKKDRQLSALQEAVEEYEQEVDNKVTVGQLSDALLEASVNDLTGRHPPKRRKGR